MNKTALAAVVVIVLVLGIGAVYYLTLPKDEGNNGTTPETKFTANGKEYSWKDISGLEMKTVNGTEGVSLSAIINHSGLASPAEHQYRVLAADGFAKNVTWGNMMEGVLAKVVDGKNTTYKTAFSTLPKRYNVKEVVDIQVITTDTLTVAGRQYTWEQPFDSMFDIVGINGTDGIRLSDLVNHTGLATPASCNYTLRASDDYNKTVDWSSMQSGILVQDGHKTLFEFLAKAYQVKDLVTIEAVPVG
jgi:hypothetical protein